MKTSLENKYIKLLLLNYGARIQSLIIKEKNIDIVLGFDNEEDYHDSDRTYFGATIGRNGNRIKRGTFTLNNKVYHLNNNENNNHLHGGISGFNDKIWDTKVYKNKVVYTYLSKDNEENYPGDLLVKVTYKLINNKLLIDYKAKSNKDTIINLTNHAHFNLNGKGNILNHKFFINANYYVPVDNELIPYGYFESVYDTPFDFLNYKEYSKVLDFDNEQIKFANGLDHDFVLNKKGVLKASVIGDISNIKMDVYTNFNGLQIYGNNHTNIEKGKNNTPYLQSSGFALECQNHPDAINNPIFKNAILKKNKLYHKKTLYKFSV